RSSSPSCWCRWSLSPFRPSWTASSPRSGQRCRTRSPASPPGDAEGALISTTRWPTGRGHQDGAHVAHGSGRLHSRAESTVSDARTEKPTPRRLREARKEGHGFTRSPEVAVAFSLLGSVLSLRLIAPAAVERGAIE